MTRLLRALRLVKLLRFARLLRVFSAIEDNGLGMMGVATASKLVVQLFIVAHVMACGFIVVCKHSGDKWWEAVGVTEDETFAMYVGSVYWAFTTMTTVGYGDVVPASDPSRQYCIAMMVLGTLLFAYVVGSLTSLFAPVNREGSDSIALLNDYFTISEVSPWLRRQCIEYFEEVRLRSRVFNEKEVLDNLPDNLRNSPSTEG